MFRQIVVVATIAAIAITNADDGLPNEKTGKQGQTIVSKNVVGNSYCGRLPSYDIRPLKRNIRHVQHELNPWNVALFKEKDYMCGGTLIAANLVVTGAHCFMLGNDTSEYKIAVGKYTNDILLLDNQHTQIVGVKEIHVEDDYFEIFNYYANDIAIMVLNNDVKISNVVSPICIDWNKKYTIQNGAIGQINGWGFGENGIMNPNVSEITLSYIDVQSCRKMSNGDFRNFITINKICAVSTASPLGGKKISSGFSGAGLTFFHDGLHYLTGITIAMNPNNEKLVIFTNINRYITWISNIYNNNIGSEV